MAHFDVTEFSQRNYQTLSGGERQRVNFARVLAQLWRDDSSTGRYLFLDEPLTFLDIRHQIDFMKKVRAFAVAPDVVTVGVVHDLNLAARFADHIVSLNHGRLVATGTPTDVLTAHLIKRHSACRRHIRRERLRRPALLRLKIGPSLSQLNVVSGFGAL
jgi:iron complex transport system ATP-binding protein